MNDYYVYFLIDPLNCKPFYIGKGVGNRVAQHFYEAKRPISKQENTLKCRRINNIHKRGDEVECATIHTSLSEQRALQLEQQYIKYYGLLVLRNGILTNIITDQQANGRRLRKVDKIDIVTKNIITTYNSIKEAANDCDIIYSNIQRCCAKKCNNSTAGGFQWTYSGDTPMDIKSPDELYAFNMKKVYQYNKLGELINEYRSVGSASISINRDRTTLINHLRGKTKTCGGFIWSYVNRTTSAL